MFQQEGFKVGGAGQDRVHRLWRRNGLKVPQKVYKHIRLGTIESGITRHAATHIDHVWTYDFVNDQTIDGRPLKILTVVNKHAHECMAAPVTRSFTSGDMVRTLAGLLATRGVPSTSAATSARSSSPSACAHNWRRTRRARCTSSRGALWQNGVGVSFNGKLCDKCLNLELFTSMTEARVVIGDYREHLAID